MDECDESEDKAVLPAQKLQQPQPVQGAKDENSGARDAPDNGGGKPGESEASAGIKGFDQARFAAGIARFYEAVLKEPIPAKMLRLVGEIEKRERQS